MPYPLAAIRGGLGLLSGKAATPWYLAGGVTLSEVAGVWQPYGAASLAASYLRIAGDAGNANIDPAVVGGVAPTWDAIQGWLGNGTSKYLKTGITPVAGMSAIVMYMGNPLGIAFMFGGDDSVSARFGMIPNAAGGIYYCNGQVLTISGGLPSAVLAIAGNKGYRNGAPETGTIGAWSGTSKEIYLLADNNGAAANFWLGYIRAIAFYHTPLAADKVLAVYNKIITVIPPIFLQINTYSSTIGV